MEELKRGRGRPKKAPDEKLERLVLFVPPPVIEKVEKHGHDWARKALQRAKPPKPDE